MIKPTTMTSAGRSVCYFGFYLYAVGFTLIVIPNMFLQTLKLPETNEVWIRIVGVLAFCLGFYYHRSGVQNNVSFFKLTVPVRIFVCVVFSIFVLLKYVSPILVGIGVVDLLGAIWTYYALKK
jgi:hypothetical protein